MKSKRNDSCPCGSNKKIKNCCGQKGSINNDSNKIINSLISFGVGVLIVVLIWGVIEFYSSDQPDMEAYKCDNPNCGKIHYRPKTDTN